AGDGTVQTVGVDVRITGRITDVNSGKVLGSFKASGTQRDLFALEDAVVAQITAIVSPQPQPVMIASPQALPSTQSAPAPGAPSTYRPVLPYTLDNGGMIGGGYEGSDLQRAVRSGRSVTESGTRSYVAPQEDYYPPSYQNAPYYPVGYSNYGYGLGSSG